MNATHSTTEADVAAFLIAQRAAIGVPQAQLTVYVSGSFPDEATWMVGLGQPDVLFRAGRTLVEAVAKAKADIVPPEKMAAAKRADAAKLLAEAEALEREAKRVGSAAQKGVAA